jgi:hypothetical protein
VLGGDVVLKFMIQWIASSFNKKKINFYCMNDPIQSKLELIYDLLKNKNIS